MTEPISLETAKNYLKVDTGDDNTLITDLISAAREMAESFSSQIFLTKTIELVYDNAGDTIEIPYRPLQSVEKIEVISEAGVKSDVSSDLYNVDLPGSFLPGRICLKPGCTWPDHRGFASFVITIKAGYGDEASSVPYSIKQAILQAIAHIYDNRETKELPEGARVLLQPYRLYRI